MRVRGAQTARLSFAATRREHTDSEAAHSPAEAPCAK